MANEQTAMEYYFFGIEDDIVEKATGCIKKGDNYWKNVVEFLTGLSEEQTLYKNLSPRQRDWLSRIQEDLT